MPRQDPATGGGGTRTRRRPGGLAIRSPISCSWLLSGPSESVVIPISERQLKYIRAVEGYHDPVSNIVARAGLV
jgi:hypothetical protein